MARAKQGGVAAQAVPSAPSAASGSPFGKPILVSEAPVVPKAEGIQNEVAFAPKTLPGDDGSIHPQDRMNKEHRDSAAEAAAKRAKEIKEAFGYGRTAIVVGASPNSIPRVAQVFG